LRRAEARLRACKGLPLIFVRRRAAAAGRATCSPPAGLRSSTHLRCVSLMLLRKRAAPARHKSHRRLRVPPTSRSHHREAFSKRNRVSGMAESRVALPASLTRLRLPGVSTRAGAREAPSTEQREVEHVPAPRRTVTAE
jgi:hypothetical protein